MKRLVLWLAAAALLLFAGGAENKTDIARLEPIAVIRVEKIGREIRVETDTGQSGTGADLAAAFTSMKCTAPAELFLDTAEFLLLSKGASDQLPALAGILRPGCEICTELGEVDLQEAADYLRIHKPGITLREFSAGIQQIPVLYLKDGRMEMEYEAYTGESDGSLDPAGG